MQQQQLEGFVTAARHGNVSRAAEVLHLTQPGLSARLQALESHLGARLLVRTSRGVQLSDTGKAFLPFAERALDTLAEGVRHIEDIKNGIAGHLALATAPSISTYVLPGMLRRFRAAYPNIHVTVRTGHPGEVLELVLRGEVNLGLGCNVEHPEIVGTPLYNDELVLVMSPEHAKARQRELTLGQLAREQLIMFRASSFLDLLTDLFRQAGVQPRAMIELDNIDTAKKMVEHGLGVALLPRIAVEAELRLGTLTTRPLREARRMPRMILAIRRADAGAPEGPVANFLTTPIVADEAPAIAAVG